jgi:hypothetical protein
MTSRVKKEKQVPQTDEVPLLQAEHGDDTDLELGEYLLHVYIQETRGLKINEPIDGIIKMEAFSKEKYTNVKEEITPGTSTFWGQHIFADFNFKTRNELENSYFKLSVYDHNTLVKNSLIGETSMSCLRVHSAKDSTMKSRWAVLTNSKKELCTSMGFIKYSVNFVRAGQKRTNLEEVYDPKVEKNALIKLDLPPEILMKQQQMIIYLFKGARIVKMDSVGGGADPYVKVDLGGLKIKTDYKKDQLEPVFAQKLFIPTIYPSVVNKVKLNFKDHDTLGSNEYIGSTSFKIDEIAQGKYANPRWTYFYGAHEDAESKEFKEKMNRIPEIASRFKGALCLAIELRTVESAAFKIEEMTTEEYELYKEVNVVENFQMHFFIEYIQNIKSTGRKHKLCFNWGGKEIFSDPIVYNKGVFIINKPIQVSGSFGIPKKLFNEWNEFKSEVLCKQILEYLPDLVLSIVADNKHIAFYRFKPHRYPLKRNNESQSEAIKMHADQAVSNLTEDHAGIMRVKASCGIETQFAGHLPPWHKNPALMRPSYTPIKLVCNLFQAKGLLSSDESGYSDPVVQLYHFGSTTQSAMFPQTLNPIWNQRMILNTYMVGNYIPSAIMNIWDRDEDWLGTRNFEFLGYTIINVVPELVVRKDFDQIKNPKWYDLCLGKNNPAGKVLAAFQVIPKDCWEAFEEFKKSQNQFWRIPVEKVRQHIKINILGLRDLESKGLFPVKTAGIKIATTSLKSVESMQKGSAFSDLTAISKTSGDNPSIGTVLSLSADIPKDKNIMPVISGTVFEMGYRMLGSDSNIGNFAISLGTFSVITKENLVVKLKALKSKYLDKEDLLNAIEQLIYKIEGSVKQTKKVIRANTLMGFNNFLQPQVHKKQIQEHEKRSKNKEFIVETIGNNYDDDDEDDMEEEKEKGGGFGISIIGKKVLKKAIVRHENETNDIEDEMMKELKEIREAGKTKKQKSTIFDDSERPKQALNFDFFNKGGNKNFLKKITHVLAKDVLVVIDTNDSRFDKDQIDTTNFLPLGYATQQKNEKHYRKVITGPLEESNFMGKEIFFTLNIHRGKKVNLKKNNLLARVFGNKDEKFRKVGKFRGIIEVLEDSIIREINSLPIEKPILEEYQLPYSIEKFKHNKLDTEILRSVEVVIRVYVIDAVFSKSFDFNSENDSYLVVKLDKKKIKDGKKIMDRNSPKFFSTFIFEHTLPGPSELKIKFYDYDPIKFDEFIGETVIDIEKRFFDQQWRNFKQHPIETRSIYHPSSSVEVGTTRLFVEMYDKNMKIPPPRNISPRPTMEVELRVIIWEIWDIAAQDFEDVSDLFVDVRLPSFNMSMKTDTHYRAQGGFGSFNWRIKFKLKIDEYFTDDMANIDFRIYDRDLFSSNDYVSSTSVNIADLIEQTLYKETRQSYFGLDEDNKENNRFVKETILSDNAEDRDMIPKIRMSIDCLTMTEAEISPAGIGRGDPNQDPHLPAPKGRFQWTMNPIKLFEQLVGPQFRKKACLICCLVFCVLVIILVFPVFFSEIIATLFTKLFGL